MTFEEAINLVNKVVAEYRKEHAQLAEYKDKTAINNEWLENNGFERKNYDTFLYCNDAVEVSVRIVDTEAGIWVVYITFLDDGSEEKLSICTLGQLKMFLSIYGFDNITNNSK